MIKIKGFLFFDLRPNVDDLVSFFSLLLVIALIVLGNGRKIPCFYFKTGKLFSRPCSEVPCLPAEVLQRRWVCSEPGSDSFKTPEVCCVDIYLFMILYIFWESRRVASRSYILWTRREGFPLTAPTKSLAQILRQFL